MNLYFKQQNVGETTYLVFDMEDGSLLEDSFAINMMAHNHMTNVVSAQIVRINEKRQAQFNITGLVKLNNRMATARSKKEVLLIFNSILNAFEEVDAYMLDMDHLLLDWEYIYLDGQGNCMLLYLPFDHAFNRDKIDFLREGVSRIKPDFQEKDPYLYDILNAFSRGAVRKLSDFRELIKRNTGILKQESGEERKSELLENIQESIVHVVNTPLQKKEEKTLPEVIAGKSDKKASISPKIPVINIPGREPGAKAVNLEPVPEKKEEKKKDEKRGFFKKKSEKQSSFLIPKKQKEVKTAIPTTEKRKMPDCVEPLNHNANNGEEVMYISYESTIMMAEPAGGLDGDAGTVLLQQAELLEQISARLVRKQGEITYRIDSDKIMIGSGETANIRIENNHAISRSHALIQYINGEYYVEDNQSKNGTFVNGKRIQPRMKERLFDGTILRLADEDFEFFRK